MPGRGVLRRHRSIFNAAGLGQGPEAGRVQGRGGLGAQVQGRRPAVGCRGPGRLQEFLIRGGEVVGNLARLYDYCSWRLYRAGGELDPAMVDPGMSESGWKRLVPAGIADAYSGSDIPDDFAALEALQLLYQAHEQGHDFGAPGESAARDRMRALEAAPRAR